ncbi:MAG: outer membrane beta-barrel protein [Campylobacterota bacterium]|nr:outer membrane beta-barrel protein [Campylobacterota bacterium]
MNKTLSMVAILAISGSIAFAGGNIYQPIDVMPEKEVVVVDDNVKYDGFYLGAALSYARMNQAVELRNHALTIVGGYYFNQYIGIEARYTRTLTDVYEDRGRIVVKTEDDLSNVGLYVKPMYNITTGFSAYGLAGYGKAEAGDLEESGFQWGLGTKYELANGMGLFVDFMSLYNGENFDGTNVKDTFFSYSSAGVTYTF